VDILPIQKVQIANRISIMVTQYNLFKSVLCQVNLYDAMGHSIHDQVVLVDGEDFNLWSDDQDLINIVIRKMNLQPVQIQSEEKTIEQTEEQINDEKVVEDEKVIEDDKDMGL
jgi:hypothetical protein